MQKSSILFGLDAHIWWMKALLAAIALPVVFLLSGTF
jgi:hypothetical protein